MFSSSFPTPNTLPIILVWSIGLEAICHKDILSTCGYSPAGWEPGTISCWWGEDGRREITGSGERERGREERERQLVEQEVKKRCRSAEQEFKEDNDDRDRCVGVVLDS